MITLASLIALVFFYRAIKYIRYDSKGKWYSAMEFDHDISIPIATASIVAAFIATARYMVTYLP